jgi:hypothetical protein
MGSGPLSPWELLWLVVAALLTAPSHGDSHCTGAQVPLFGGHGPYRHAGYAGFMQAVPGTWAHWPAVGEGGRG